MFAPLVGFLPGVIAYASPMGKQGEESRASKLAQAMSKETLVLSTPGDQSAFIASADGAAGAGASAGPSPFARKWGVSPLRRPGLPPLLLGRDAAFAGFAFVVGAIHEQVILSLGAGDTGDLANF